MKYSAVKSIILKAQRDQAWGNISTTGSSTSFHFDYEDEDPPILSFHEEDHIIGILSNGMHTYVDTDSITYIDIYQKRA